MNDKTPDRNSDLNNSKIAQQEIFKSIAERKQVGMGALKGWDQVSRENLHLMKSLIDSMFVKLDNIILDSNFRYEKISQFFSQMKMNFQSDFSFKEHLPKFQFVAAKTDKKSLEPINPEENAFASYIEAMEQQMTLFQTSINNFQKQIESTIIKKTLLEKVKKSEENLKELMSQKKNLKDKLTNLSQKTKDSFLVLTKLLKEALSSNIYSKRPSVNLFESVFIFVDNVRKLATIVRDYGIYLIDIFQAAKNLEKDRLSATRDAFFEFNQLLEKSFAGTQLQGLKNGEFALRKITNLTWDAEHFNTKLLLTQEQSELIKKRTNSSILTLDKIKEFVIKEKIEENIKELFDFFVMRRFLVKEIDKKNSEKYDVVIYLTIDYYYTIYQYDKEKRKHKLLANVPFEEVELYIKDSNVVTFIFNEIGFLWNSKKKLSFVFSNDTKEELKMDHETYLSLLKIGDGNKNDSLLKSSELIDGSGNKLSQSRTSLTSMSQKTVDLKDRHIDQIGDSKVETNEKKDSQLDALKNTKIESVGKEHKEEKEILNTTNEENKVVN